MPDITGITSRFVTNGLSRETLNLDPAILFSQRLKTGYSVGWHVIMYKFEYRAPRYPVSLPIRLALEGSIFAGDCLEISMEGMKVKFHHPLRSGTCGTVSSEYGNSGIDVPVRVAYSGSDFQGLEFLPGSAKDRAAVEHLLAMITAPAPRPGPFRIK